MISFFWHLLWFISFSRSCSIMICKNNCYVFPIDNNLAHRHVIFNRIKKFKLAAFASHFKHWIGYTFTRRHTHTHNNIHNIHKYSDIYTEIHAKQTKIYTQTQHTHIHTLPRTQNSFIAMAYSSNRKKKLTSKNSPVTSK